MQEKLSEERRRTIKKRMKEKGKNGKWDKKVESLQMCNYERGKEKGGGRIIHWYRNSRIRGNKDRRRSTHLYIQKKVG